MPVLFFLLLQFFGKTIYLGAPFPWFNHCCSWKPPGLQIFPLAIWLVYENVQIRRFFYGSTRWICPVLLSTSVNNKLGCNQSNDAQMLVRSHSHWLVNVRKEWTWFFGAFIQSTYRVHSYLSPNSSKWTTHWLTERREWKVSALKPKMEGTSKTYQPPTRQSRDTATNSRFAPFKKSLKRTILTWLKVRQIDLLLFRLGKTLFIEDPFVVLSGASYIFFRHRRRPVVIRRLNNAWSSPGNTEHSVNAGVK